MNFEKMGLPPAMNAALAKMNYTTPTPIQTQAIPAALEGCDIVGSAQTGTGKTGAFCIPMIAHLIKNPNACALVMTPTRELATQVLTVAAQLSNIRTALLIGGDSMQRQFRQLDARPRLIVGTPGRINDHLRRNRHLLDAANFLVLDEADRMLDMGFSIQIDEVLKFLPTPRQTLMFSATFPTKIVEFSKRYMNSPLRVAVQAEKTSADNIVHEIVQTTADRKYKDLITQLDARSGSIIIFVKTKRGADKLAKALKVETISAEAIHGDLRQNKRDHVLNAFRAKKCRILIATDVASRGLDVPHVAHVINYDLPQVPEDYIHRIGRTARAGAKGHAMCFITPADRGMWSAINRILNPGDPANAERHSEPRRPGKPGGKRRSGGPKPWQKGAPRKSNDNAQRAGRPSRTKQWA